MADTINKVTGFDITLMSGSFGWIELMNGEQIAGYIYLVGDEVPPADKLGNVDGRNGQPPYVVMHEKFADAMMLLHVLKEVPNLQIRFSGQSAFLENRISSAATFGEGRIV